MMDPALAGGCKLAGGLGTRQCHVVVFVRVLRAGKEMFCCWQGDAFWTCLDNTDGDSEMSSSCSLFVSQVPSADHFLSLCGRNCASTTVLNTCWRCVRLSVVCPNYPAIWLYLSR